MATPNSAGSIESLDEVFFGFDIHGNRRNSLLMLLNQNLQDIKDKYSKLCLLIRQYRRHHQYINRYSYCTMNLIIQQRISYTLIQKIITGKDILDENVRHFCLDSERDTGHEKHPLHYHIDISKIKKHLQIDGVIENHINNINDKFNRQLEQTLRVIEYELYSLTRNNQQQTGEQYILNNLGSPIIKDFIVRKGNGIDDKSMTCISIIAQIISYYHNFITS